MRKIDNVLCVRWWLLGLSALCSGCSDQPAKSSSYALQGAYAANISANGKYALVGSINHGGSLWDIQAGERLYNWNHDTGEYTGLTAVALSAEGAYAMTADERRVVLWATQGGEAVGFWEAPARVLSLSLSRSGRYALVGLNDSKGLYVNNRQGGILRVLDHGGDVVSVAISADGRLGLTGSDDRQARLWDLSRGMMLNQVKHGNSVDLVALSNSGALAFSAGQRDRGIVWSVANGDVLMEISTQATALASARFSDDDQYLLTGTTRREIALWDITSGLQVEHWLAPRRKRWPPIDSSIYAVAFAPDQRSVYSLTSQGTLYEWPY